MFKSPLAHREKPQGDLGFLAFPRIESVSRWAHWAHPND